MAKEEKVFLKRFGARVSAIRRQRGMTQEQLADATELHRTYIGFIEQGKRNPLIGNVYKIAKALKTSLKELVENLD